MMFMHKEIKNRLNSENACCHLVQTLLSSHLLSRNVRAKIYKTIQLFYTGVILGVSH
jgi:hypothetical protein